MPNLTVFRQLRDIIASIFGTKHDTDNALLESTKGSIHSPKVSRNLVYKRQKIGRAFNPPSVNYVVCFFASLRTGGFYPPNSRTHSRKCQTLPCLTVVLWK